MKEQELENKRGEVAFRRSLYEQQVLGEERFDDELDAGGIEEVLRRRMADTVREIGDLRAAGVPVAPYVEVGAERGQRALALENELGLEGAAVDLSLDLLRASEHYRRRFGLERRPLRICADAYRLPFASDSVPFVFCYQTLHHFPNPAPVVAEIHRVLMPGGHFYFAEEPYRRRLRWRLYTVRRGAQVSRPALLRVLDRLFAREVVTEETFGVIENHDMTVWEWRGSLEVFDQVRLTLRTARILRIDPDRNRNPLARLAAHLLGGLVSGLCRKEGTLDPEKVRPLDECLVSPAALARGEESPLVRDDGTWSAPDAGRGRTARASGDAYPLRDGVALLLEPGLRRELYPEVDP